MYYGPTPQGDTEQLHSSPEKPDINIPDPNIKMTSVIKIYVDFCCCNILFFSKFLFLVFY